MIGSLFAHDAVIGPRRADADHDERLGGSVHLGDHVGRRRLRRHLDSMTTEALDEQGRGVGGEVGGHGQQLVEQVVHGGHRRVRSWWSISGPTRSPSRPPRCARRWRTPRWATTATARIPPCAASRSCSRRGREGSGGVRAVGDDGQPDRTSAARPSRHRGRDRSPPASGDLRAGRRRHERLVAVRSSRRHARRSSGRCARRCHRSPSSPLASGERGVRGEHPHAVGRGAVVARATRGRRRVRPTGASRRRSVVQRVGRDGSESRRLRERGDHRDVLLVEGLGCPRRLDARLVSRA